MLMQKTGVVPVDLVISIPSRANWSPRFAKGLMELNIPISHAKIMDSGHPIDISRNITITKALQSNAKYIFFVDSDVVLKPDTLTTLLGLKMPMVSAVYRSRGEPYQILANDSNKLPIDPTVLQQQQGVIKVDQVGMGACLIDMRVIKNIALTLNEWRCFVDHSKQLGKDVAVYDTVTASENGYKCKICNNSMIARFFMSRNAMFNINGISEDYYFCLQVRNAGFNIGLHPGIVLNHINEVCEIDGLTGKLVNPLSSVAEVQ